MAVTWNNNLGAFQVNGRGFFATQEEAQAADTTAIQAEPINQVTSDSFAQSFATPQVAKAPAPRATSPDGLTYTDTGQPTPLYYERQRAMNDPTFEVNETAFVPQDVRDPNSRYKFDPAQGLYYTEDNHGRRTYVGNDPQKQARAVNTPIFTYNPTAAPKHNPLTTAGGVAGGALTGATLGGPVGAVIGGVAGGLSTLPQASGGSAYLSAGDGSVGGRQGTAAEAEAKNAQYAATGSSVGATLPGGGGTGGVPPGGTTSDQLIDAEIDTNQAEADWRNTEADNSAENANLWSNLWDQYDKVGDADYGLSDEARGYQREGLQQQRMLLERMLGFDPNQYATQFADQALARTVAAGRSGPGGFAAQQAGMFAANEQAPALYAEGARMAAGLENQRLQAAAGVAKTFGELGTMTRGQDETRAQFDATLPLELAKAMTNATQGQVAMNEQESQRFADIYMNFAQLQATYAGMSSQEQMAWWDREMAQKGLDQQWNMFKQELAQQGKITAKDILGGVFSLGGAAITGGGSILAARAARGA